MTVPVLHSYAYILQGFRRLQFSLRTSGVFGKTQSPDLSSQAHRGY